MGERTQSSPRGAMSPKTVRIDPVVRAELDLARVRRGEKNISVTYRAAIRWALDDPEFTKEAA